MRWIINPPNFQSSPQFHFISRSFCFDKISTKISFAEFTTAKVILLWSFFLLGWICSSGSIRTGLINGIRSIITTGWFLLLREPPPSQHLSTCRNVQGPASSSTPIRRVACPKLWIVRVVRGGRPPVGRILMKRGWRLNLLRLIPIVLRLHTHRGGWWYRRARARKWPRAGNIFQVTVTRFRLERIFSVVTLTSATAVMWGWGWFSHGLVWSRCG